MKIWKAVIATSSRLSSRFNFAALVDVGADGWKLLNERNGEPLPPLDCSDRSPFVGPTALTTHALTIATPAEHVRLLGGVRCGSNKHWHFARP